MSGPVLSRPVALADIRGRLEMEVTATGPELAAIAAEYDLLGLSSLSARLVLTGDTGAVDVQGHVTADLEQACVVTLVPVAQHIDEGFSLRFVRPGSPELPEAPGPNAEVVVNPEAPDPPEVLAGNTLDLGPIVEEAFVLAIDLYPRAPDAELPHIDDGDAKTDESPFAVLAHLKRDAN